MEPVKIIPNGEILAENGIFYLVGPTWNGEYGPVAAVWTCGFVFPNEEETDYDFVIEPDLHIDYVYTEEFGVLVDNEEEELRCLAAEEGLI